MTVQWTEASDALRAAQSILVVTHFNPDGDAIGSMLGLGLALRQMDKRVICAVDGGVPPFLKFLTGADTVLKKVRGGKYDLMIATDCGDLSRAGDAGAVGARFAGQVINLDHHPTNDHFGDLQLVVPEAVSAAEVVFDWLSTLDHPIDADIATALLTGMVTDTLGFRVNSVSTRTLAIASKLMDAGASLYDISSRTLDSRSFATLDLWKRALTTLNMDDGIISAVVRYDDVKAAGLIDPTDGGLVSLLIQVDEAQVSLVLKEYPDGRLDISMRAKPGFNVAEVAESFGGGGHTLAAGAQLDGPIDEAKAAVMARLQEAVRKGAPARA